MPDFRQTTEQWKWIGEIAPYAKRWSSQTGIPAEVYVAILASETNYGKAPTFFGIKGSGTAGSQNFATHEVVNGQAVNVNDNFAVYNNPDEAHDAFIELVSTSPRYSRAWREYNETGNWKTFLDGINQAGYATDPEWSNKITSMAQGYAKSDGRELSMGSGARTIGTGATAGSASRTTSTRGFVEPTLEDFKIYEQDQATGQQVWTGEYDVQSFNRAMAEYRAGESSEDDFAKYLDTVINAASTEIEMGNANVSKARQEFERQMQAHEVAGNQFAQLLGYAVPAGASYVPGREPGGFYEKMGLSPRQASGQYFDPFAEAFKIVQRTPDLTTINTNPTGAMLPSAVSAARSLAGGGNGSTGSGLATGAPPLPTSPNPPPAPTEAQRIAQEFMMNQSRQPNYASNLAAQYDGA